MNHATNPESEHSSGQRALSAWQTAVGFGIAYFLAAEAAGHLSTFRNGYVSFWLPAGMYLAALLLNGRKLWLSLVLAAFAANLAFDLSHGVAIPVAFAFACANTLQACAGAWLMTRFVPNRPTLATIREYLWLLGCAALSAMLGATAGASALVCFRLNPSFTSAWAAWWSGNAMALVLVTPFILIMAPGSRHAHPRRPDKSTAILEALLLVCMLIGISYYILFFKQGVLYPNKAAFVVPLLWAGIRFGPRGAACSSLLLALIFAFFTARYSAGLTPAQAASDETVFILHSVLMVAAVIGMIPGIIIRERDRTLADLRASEDRYQLALRGSLDGLWDWNILTNQSFHGRQFLNFLGYSNEDEFPATHASFESHLHPDDVERTQRAIADHLERHVPFDIEFRLRTKGGEYRWFRSRGHAIWDEQGRATRMAGSIRDITAAREAERALRESEEKFSKAFSASPNGMCITELETGRLLEVNESYCHLYGYERHELIGCTSVELGIFKTAEIRARFLEPLLEGGGSLRDHELLTHHRNGQPRLVSTSAERIQLGSRDCIVTVIRDITESTKVEEQLRQSQKMDAIGQLAGGIAHDFNNMLAVIHMQTSLLLTDPGVAPQAREDLQNIMAAAERSANLTRQLLTFSRREVKREENLDLTEVVSTIIKLLRRVLGESISLDTSFASVLPMVRADPGMIEQVLMNLAINARDAMPRGGRLEVALDTCEIGQDRAASNQAEPGQYLRLAISDTGCGIPEEHLPRIFEPFFTTKGVGEGTGLGLATVFGIVRQHHGWVEVQSKVGCGTTFTVFLPAFAGPAIQAEPATSGQKVPGGSEVILLVEDEAAVRQMTRCVLENFGYRVLEASAALDALHLWSTEAACIDLLLTDIVMPGGMNGLELAEELIAQRPALKVIYVSGYTHESISRQMHLEPGRIFLQKPFTARDLAATVRRCFEEG